MVRCSRRGGDRGAHSGGAVVFAIDTGQRVIKACKKAGDSIPATGGPDKLMRLYSIKNGKPWRTIQKHTGRVTARAFSPDGEKLAATDRNGGLRRGIL